MINSLRRGGIAIIDAPSVEIGVSVVSIDSGVLVAVSVAVGAGKINVMAGNGAKVVVGVDEGSAVDVGVGRGVPCVAVGPAVLVPEAWLYTSA